MRRLLQICLLSVLPYVYADPQYCTRMFHSAIINNQTLFIDGGEMTTVDGNNITYAPVRDLLAVDLSKSWSNTDSDLFQTIVKPSNDSDPDAYPTYLNAGASYSDGSNLYFYGGYVSALAGNETVPPVDTWKYEISSNKWTRDGFGGSLFSRLSLGLTAQSTVSKKAYYLGGVVTPGGNPNIWGTNGAATYIVSGLLTLDENSLQWSNTSSLQLNNDGTVGDGYMNIIETVGDEGILVSFGGFTHPIGEDVSILTSDNVNDTFHNSMEYVSIYDIANKAWYTQQTSGDVPLWRMSGCSIVAPAQDQSSFSIYVFGGFGINTANSDGDVYVLSLPSFTWIRVNDDNNKIRIRHKCALAGKHTMLSVGGSVPQDNDELHPRPVNCDDSGVFTNGLGIFDLRSHTWLSNYNASDDGEYTLSSTITSVIGGNETGGANVTQPQNGFNGTSLASLFARRNTVSSSSITAGTSNSATSGTSDTLTTGAKNSHGNKLSGGAIAGIAVGAAVAAAIAAVAFVFITRRRSRQSKMDQDQNSGSWASDHRKRTQGEPAELLGTRTAHEMGTTANIAEKPADPIEMAEMDGTGVL